MGQAVKDAASGDTIVVLPGVYLESIDVEDKELVIQSTGGPDSTTLALPSGMEASVLFSREMKRGLTLPGFTLRDGRGTLSPTGTNQKGGAVYLGPPDPGSFEYVTIEECVFENNRVAPGQLPPWYTVGGALAIDYADEVILRDCTFRENYEIGGSNDVYLEAPERVKILGSEFVARGDGNQVIVSGGDECEISGCLFWGMAHADYSASLQLSSLETRIIRNRFIDLAGPVVNRVEVDDESLGAPLYKLVVDHNIFYVVPGEWDGRGLLFGQFDNAEVNIESNTFVGVGVAMTLHDGPSLTVHRNLFVRGALGIGSYAPGTVSCTVWWPERIVVGGAGIEFLNEVVGDPMFCDEGAFDFRVDPDGVCGPEHSPGECGVIGAESADCAETPIVVTLDVTCGSGGTEVSWSTSGEAGLLEARIYRSRSTCFEEAELVEHAAPEHGSFLDDAPAGSEVCWYWIVVVDQSGKEHLAGPVNSICETRSETALRLESRNPSDDGIFRFRVALGSSELGRTIALRVHDVTGREVARHPFGPGDAGGTVTLDLSDQANGIYYVALSMNGVILDGEEVVVLR